MTLSSSFEETSNIRNVVPKRKKKIIIPGCGNGHDALYLAHKGHDVYAIDFSTVAIKRLRVKAEKEKLKINILHKDYFKLSNYYNFFDIFR